MEENDVDRVNKKALLGGGLGIGRIQEKGGGRSMEMGEGG